MAEEIKQTTVSKEGFEIKPDLTEIPILSFDEELKDDFDESMLEGEEAIIDFVEEDESIMEDIEDSQSIIDEIDNESDQDFMSSTQEIEEVVDFIDESVKIDPDINHHLDGHLDISEEDHDSDDFNKVHVMNDENETENTDNKEYNQLKVDPDIVETPPGSINEENQTEQNNTIQDDAMIDEMITLDDTDITDVEEEEDEVFKNFNFMENGGNHDFQQSNDTSEENDIVLIIEDEIYEANNEDIYNPELSNLKHEPVIEENIDIPILPGESLQDDKNEFDDQNRLNIHDDVNEEFIQFTEEDFDEHHMKMNIPLEQIDKKEIHQEDDMVYLEDDMILGSENHIINNLQYDSLPNSGLSDDYEEELIIDNSTDDISDDIISELVGEVHLKEDEGLLESLSLKDDEIDLSPEIKPDIPPFDENITNVHKEMIINLDEDDSDSHLDYVLLEEKHLEILPEKQIEVDNHQIQSQVIDEKISENIITDDKNLPQTEEIKLDVSVTDSQKEEIKEILKYMDTLFADLPTEKIKEFANSKYYELYNKIFDELGI